MADVDDMRLKNELRYIKSVYAIGGNRLSFVTLTYKVKNDERDSKNYPLNGYYADIEIKKHGIGIDQPNLNITKFTLNYRNYYFLKSRWYLSHGFFAEAFSFRDQSPIQYVAAC